MFTRLQEISVLLNDHDMKDPFSCWGQFSLRKDVLQVLE